MKKFLAVMFIFTAITAVTVYAFNVTPVRADTDYLRIHVRANSNEQIDKSVKYIVKDEVVKFITPYAAQCTDKQKAVELVKSILPEIEKVCDRTLKAHGFGYTSKADVRAEEFPTRV